MTYDILTCAYYPQGGAAIVVARAFLPPGRSGGAAGSLGGQTPQAGASLEGKARAGLVERFLREVHGCPSLFACTARLASELGAPWASTHFCVVRADWRMVFRARGVRPLRLSPAQLVESAACPALVWAR